MSTINSLTERIEMLEEAIASQRSLLESCERDLERLKGTRQRLLDGGHRCGRLLRDGTSTFQCNMDSGHAGEHKWGPL